MSARKSPAPAPLEPHWFQILLAVADRDLHGLAIMNDVLERTGGRMRLWPGMLYRALGRLADMNLVVEIEPPDGAAAAGGRPRFFRITRPGAARAPPKPSGSPDSSKSPDARSC